MKTQKCSTKAIKSAICTGLFLTANLVFADSYHIDEVPSGTLDPADYTVANAINDSGIIGGTNSVMGAGYRAYFETVDPSISPALISDTGGYHDATINDLSIGSLGVGWVGNFSAGGAGRPVIRHAAIFTYGPRVIEIGALPGDVSSEATAVNNAGWVVGTSGIPGRAPRAFLWVPTASDITQPGSMYELPCTELGGNVNAESINLGGWIGGTCGTKPYIWAYGNGYDISSWLPPRIDMGDAMSVDRANLHSYCSVKSISDNYGFAVNCLYELAPSRRVNVAYVSTPASPTLTQVPRIPGTAANRYGDVAINSINKNGCAVGSAGIPMAPWRTAISFCDGVLTDLNTVATSKTLFLYSATDINNHGKILVNSILRSVIAVPSVASSYPVVLTPR